MPPRRSCRDRCWRRSCRAQAPRVVTTLHGTDITLVGNDPSYSEIVAFSIDQSDRVTAVSKSLRDSTYAELGVTREIEVIPNFLDCGVHRAGTCRRCASGSPADDERTHRGAHLELPAGEAHRRTSWRSSIAFVASARAAAAGGRWPRAPGARTAPPVSSALRRSCTRSGAQEEVLPLLSVSRRLPAAVGPGELRSGGARGDGVRGAGGGVARRWCARGDRARGQRLPAPARRARRDGRKRRQAAERCGAPRATGEAARYRVTDAFCADKIVPMYEAAYQRLLT